MSSPSQLRTVRLLLRRWRETDYAPFAVLNADPMVMEHLPSRLTRAESDDLIATFEAGFATRGFGLWALEVRTTGEFRVYWPLCTVVQCTLHTSCRGWLASSAVRLG